MDWETPGRTGSQSSLTITSGKYFSRLSWQLTGTSEIFDLGQSPQGYQGYGTSTSDLNLTLTYPFSGQWSVQGLVGYEWGNYDSLSQPGGWRWRVTPYWSPSPNTTVGLGYGWRYFGADYFADIQHQYKKTVFNLTYEIVVSNARTALLDQEVVNFQDPFGQPITNPTANQNLSGSVLNPALVSGVFVQHQLLASVARQFGRSTGTLSITQNRWDYQDSANQVDDTQGNIVFTRALSQRSSGTVGLQYWMYNQSVVGGADFTQYQLWAGMSRRVNRRVTGDARYSYSQRRSDALGQGYTENALWLTLNWTL